MTVNGVMTVIFRYFTEFVYDMSYCRKTIITPTSVSEATFDSLSAPL